MKTLKKRHKNTQMAQTNHSAVSEARTKKWQIKPSQRLGNV
ncbi:MAG: hypothetical protein ACJAWS_001351 [Oleiphilaceae bacterium]|jgi:hypothetical protein